jgi:DNA-binding transcriptional ArsR family regulator/uncharacterized protein YndB with AHSA1/START domain
MSVAGSVKGAPKGDVWGALANPVRRQVLDLLRDGARTTGQLADSFPGLSRFAVMQHLNVLESAGLLLVRRVGRERHNFVNPAPLEEVRTRWLNDFAVDAGRTAVALQRHLTPSHAQQKEQPMTAPAGTARAVRTESEFRVDAPPERVFLALTEEQHAWYPYTYGGDRVRDIVFEPRVGGNCYEDWGDGAGHWYGTVTHFDPPRGVTMRGGLPHSTVLENSFELEATTADDGSPSTIVRHSMTAFGELSDDDAGGIRSHGDMSLFAPQLRAWCEHNKRVR